MLEIKNLQISFLGKATKAAVRGIDLCMAKGEALALVGESGSGKTITALTLAGLVDRQGMEISGEINFCGKNLLDAAREDFRKIQGKDIGYVFQEPMTSLNPLMRIGRQIEEPLALHTDFSPTRRRELALEAMSQVGLADPELCYRKYPHELSGGQRQRAIIASAFINSPKLLIADEPTTALDVTVQAQIIELLRRINKERGIGILFISHDLNVVRRLCENVAVMRRGEIVERGRCAEVFQNPQHEYTRRLVAAIPTRERRKR